MRELDISSQGGKIDEKMTHYKGTIIELIKEKKLSSRNKSGVTGVRKTKDGRWQAYIGFQGKLKIIGVYDEYEDAVESRKTYEKIYFEKTIKEYEEEKTMNFLKNFKEVNMQTNNGSQRRCLPSLGLVLKKNNMIRIRGLKEEYILKFFKVMISDDGKQLAMIFKETEDNGTRVLSKAKNDRILRFASVRLKEALKAAQWKENAMNEGKQLENTDTFVFTRAE